MMLLLVWQYMESLLFVLTVGWPVVSLLTAGNLFSV